MSVDFPGLLLRLGEIFLYICLGGVGRRTGLLDDTANKVLSRMILYIGFPAVLLNSVISVDIVLAPSDILLLLAVAVLWQAVCVLVGWLLAKLLTRDPRRRGMYAFVLSFGNVGAFALPVLQPLFGIQGMAMAALMNAPFPLLAFTAGVRMISGRKLTGREMVRGMVIPQMVAALLIPVLFLLRPSYPPLVVNTVRGLNSIALPLLMMMVGSSLAAGGLKLWKGPRVYLASALKLLLIPLALYPLLHLALADPVRQGVTVLMTGMPTAGIATSMCILYDNPHEAEAGGITVATSLLSLLTIPLLAKLLL